ncbi:hypothetical protein DYB32_005931 [Aphanomyces invadans]|uniref:Oxidoreductase n=1 Tax=Aphanomyces invadans TaxID=157072 RepID=A0A3R7CYZ0_9STRA|nr:hypothetical protein DYB32_005931 [Aphanomyces invadans]
MDTAVAAAATVQVDPQDLATCIRVLEVFHGNMDALKAAPFKALRRAVVPLCEDVRSRLFHGRDVASYDYSKKKKLDRKRKAQQAAALDKQFINNTKLRAQRLQALESLTAAAPMLALVPDGAVVDDAPDTPIDHEDEQPKTLHGFRSCYACKKRFDTLHHFYDQLCPDCAALNFEKRMQTADLTGYIALVTGARVKIGFHTALKLLRAGATVIATSRFPQDAAIRYANEADYDTWKAPHQPLTLTHASSGGDDDHGVLPREAVAMPAAAATTSAELSQVPLTTDDKDLSAEERAALYPVAQYDANHQQVDLRHTNSWKLKIDHVESPGKCAVPMSKAKGHRQSSRPHHFIVNVSAMEGKFYRYKTPHHPHTNMAKAAANMMTRTCADELKSRNIYMTSVDTGWINDENPRAKAQDIAMKHNFQTPLDEIDAAARILDPIFIGFQDATTQGTFPSGDFFKDYKRSEW